MASEEPCNPRWDGKSKVDLAKSITAFQVWPLLRDFCNLHKILPAIDTSRYIDGPLNQPGMIRYCAMTIKPLSGDQAGTALATTRWAHEKLIMIDHEKMRLSYQAMENTFGFGFYMATVGVVLAEGGGCKIEWSFECDPVEGWKLEDFRGLIDVCLQSMRRKIEELLLQ